ncbi:MAG: hypothetical protein WC464_07550, partial [Bdellovibrionales bacterium]
MARQSFIAYFFNGVPEFLHDIRVSVRNRWDSLFAEEFDPFEDLPTDVVHQPSSQYYNGNKPRYNPNDALAMTAGARPPEPPTPLHKEIAAGVLGAAGWVGPRIGSPRLQEHLTDIGLEFKLFGHLLCATASGQVNGLISLPHNLLTRPKTDIRTQFQNAKNWATLLPGRLRGLPKNMWDNRVAIAQGAAVGIIVRCAVFAVAGCASGGVLPFAFIAAMVGGYVGGAASRYVVESKKYFGIADKQKHLAEIQNAMDQGSKYGLVFSAAGFGLTHGLLPDACPPPPAPVEAPVVEVPAPEPYYADGYIVCATNFNSTLQNELNQTIHGCCGYVRQIGVNTSGSSPLIAVGDPDIPVLNGRVLTNGSVFLPEGQYNPDGIPVVNSTEILGYKDKLDYHAILMTNLENTSAELVPVANPTIFTFPDYLFGKAHEIWAFLCGGATDCDHGGTCPEPTHTYLRGYGSNSHSGGGSSGGGSSGGGGNDPTPNPTTNTPVTTSTTTPVTTETTTPVTTETTTPVTTSTTTPVTTETTTPVTTSTTTPVTTETTTPVTTTTTPVTTTTTPVTTTTTPVTTT